MHLFGPPDIDQLSARRDVSGLAKALRHKEPELRQQAAMALGKLGGPNAVAALIAALQDPSADVREEAVDALGKLGGRGAVAALIAARQDPSADVREAAIDALALLKDPASVGALSAALGDPDVGIRRSAVRGLWSIKNARAIEALIRAALADPSDQMWFDVTANVLTRGPLLTLARVSPVHVADAMLKALEQDGHVREVAAEVLRTWGVDADAAGGMLIPTRLAAMRYAITQCEQELNTGYSHDEWLAASDSALGSNRFEIERGELERELKSLTKKEAALLAEMPEAERRTILLADLGKDSESLRQRSAKALDALGGAYAETVRRELGYSPAEREKALARRRRRARSDLERPLMRFSYDPARSRKLGEDALQALARDDRTRADRAGKIDKLRASGDVRRLVTMLVDAGEELRSEAEDALADAKAIEPLLPLLGHEDANVAAAAARVLTRLGETRGSAWVLIDAARRDERGLYDRAARNLGRAGADAVALLQEAAHDESAAVRWSVAHVLGRCGAVEAVPLLAELLQDADEGVRDAALAGLQRIGGPDAEATIDANAQGTSQLTP